MYSYKTTLNVIAAIGVIRLVYFNSEEILIVGLRYEVFTYFANGEGDGQQITGL